MQPEDQTPDPESQEPKAPDSDPIAPDPAGAADSSAPADAGTAETSGSVTSEAPAGPDSASGAQSDAPSAETEPSPTATSDGAGDADHRSAGLSAVAGGADPQTSRETARPHAIHPVEFSQIDDEGVRGKNSLDLLMDVKLPISVELGRADAFIKDILEYGPGTVVELNKMAGDPVDILVNGRLIAQGEVVVVDDHFGVRLTALLSPKDRLRSLA